MNKKVELEGVFEHIWQQYQDLLYDFTTRTAENRKKYNVIEQVDTNIRNLMRKQVHQIASFYVRDFDLSCKLGSAKQKLSSKYLNGTTKLL